MYISGNDKIERFKTAREYLETAQRLGIKKLKEQAASWYPQAAEELKEMQKPAIIEFLQTHLTADAQ